jgi:hypothetical protein
LEVSGGGTSFLWDVCVFFDTSGPACLRPGGVRHALVAGIHLSLAMQGQRRGWQRKSSVPDFRALGETESRAFPISASSNESASRKHPTCGMTSPIMMATLAGHGHKVGRWDRFMYFIAIKILATSYRTFT